MGMEQDSDAQLYEVAREMLTELRRAQYDTCSIHCPSVWKTGQQQPHSERCRAMRAVMAKAEEALGNG